MNKFIVLKINDIESFLSTEEKSQILQLIRKIHCERLKNDKPAINKYAVINQDEPYFEEVKEIMKAHGHWEGD